MLLEVQDTGIGVEPEVLAYLFDEFFRAPNAKEYETAGTGLGLTMCKSIVENHGGTIEVLSTSSQGTTVLLRFPAN